MQTWIRDCCLAKQCSEDVALKPTSSYTLLNATQTTIRLQLEWVKGGDTNVFVRLRVRRGIVNRAITPARPRADTRRGGSLSWGMRVAVSIPGCLFGFHALAWAWYFPGISPFIVFRDDTLFGSGGEMTQERYRDPNSYNGTWQAPPSPSLALGF